MNYGKKKAAKKQKKITSRSAMQGKRVGIRLFKAFLLLVLAVCIAGVIGVGVFAKRIIDNSPEVTPDDVKPQGFTTFVYADDEKTQIERFVASGSNRVYKTIDVIPEDLQHAFVAIEDERFYEHNGIDLQGIVRAAISTISGDTQGASTLTQQLIKNNIFPNFVAEETMYDKVERKLQEQYIALQIEKQMSKEEILEAYMNTINLGQNCLGVQSASKKYFNKDVSELTLSESAVIAGITQSPSNLNPISNPEKNAKRREKVLGDMLKQGYITQEEHDEALEDDVYKRIQKVAGKTQEKVKVYSYFVDALAEQIMKDLQNELGYSREQAYNALYCGGLTIYSTQNMDMQKICDEEMSKDSNYPYLKEYGLDYRLTVTHEDGSVDNYSSGHVKNYAREKHGIKQGLLYSTKDAAKQMAKKFRKSVVKDGDTYDEVINISPQPQASVTIIDQYTGQIKAMVGGRGTKSTSLALNRAYNDSPRQPGSTFKILAAYGPAIDQGRIGLGSIINDKPYKIKGGKTIRGSRGPVTVKSAIAASLNSCAVQVGDMITPEVGFDYCEKFGITTLADSKEINGKIYTDKHQTLCLGGLTDGVYNYELCNAYATIANGGTYNTPTLYTKILDHDGNVLLEAPNKSEQVINEGTATLLTMAMKSVVSGGTGRACSLGRMPVAGKTGTTTSNKDLWFCGYTPYYTCAVWGGYDDNKECNSDTSFRFRIWRGIMSRIHADLEYKDFELSNNLVKRSVCSETGLLPYVSDGEPGSNSSCKVITEYFPEGTEPTGRCKGHEPLEEEEEEEVEEDVTDETQDTEDGNTETPPSTQPSTPPAPTPSQPSTPPTPTPPAEQPTDPAPASENHVEAIDLLSEPLAFLKRIFVA